MEPDMPLRSEGRIEPREVVHDLSPEPSLGVLWARLIRSPKDLSVGGFRCFEEDGYIDEWTVRRRVLVFHALVTHEVRWLALRHPPMLMPGIGVVTPAREMRVGGSFHR